MRFTLEKRRTDVNANGDVFWAPGGLRPGDLYVMHSDTPPPFTTRKVRGWPKGKITMLWSGMWDAKDG